MVDIQYSNKSIPIGKTGKKITVPGTFGASAQEVDEIDYLPPLNTIINVTTLPPITKGHLNNVTSMMTATNQTIPKNFDMRNKGKTTTVRNQGFCGSCWAVSTATVVNDHVLAAQGGGKNAIDPQISAGYILTNTQISPGKYSSNMGGCLGGSPAKLAQWIGQNGCGNNCCIPYQIFPKGNTTNDLILPKTPYGGATCINSGIASLVFLNNSQSNDPNDVTGYKGIRAVWGEWQGGTNTKLDPLDAYDFIKKFVYNNGSAVATMPVLSNFMPTKEYGPKTKN